MCKIALVSDTGGNNVCACDASKVVISAFENNDTELVGTGEEGVNPLVVNGLDKNGIQVDMKGVAVVLVVAIFLVFANDVLDVNAMSADGVVSDLNVCCVGMNWVEVASESGNVLCSENLDVDTGGADGVAFNCEVVTVIAVV